MPDSRPTLDIAVCTFRRPALITALLPALQEQAASVADDVEARVSIVDNDADGSALAAIEAAGLLADAPVPTRVVVEAEPGLAAARNRALDEAAHRDLLVFIDDDEEPQDGWLAALVAQWRMGGAAAVTGPVRSDLPAGTAPLAAASPLFEQAHHRTGQSRPSAATNNLLLDMRRVRDAGVRFDPRFSFTGGEDSFFTRSLVAAGGRIVWCDEALVSEAVPPERATAEWVRARATRNGESWTWVRLLSVSGGKRAVLRARLAARGLASAAVFGIRARRVQGAQARAELVHRAAGGRGIVRASLGRATQEYGRS